MLSFFKKKKKCVFVFAENLKHWEVVKIRKKYISLFPGPWKDDGLLFWKKSICWSNYQKNHFEHSSKEKLNFSNDGIELQILYSISSTAVAVFPKIYSQMKTESG